MVVFGNILGVLTANLGGIKNCRAVSCNWCRIGFVSSLLLVMLSEMIMQVDF